MVTNTKIVVKEGIWAGVGLHEIAFTIGDFHVEFAKYNGDPTWKLPTVKAISYGHAKK